MNRELFRVEDGQKSRTVETTVKMIHLFEGTNGAECCRELAKTGFMHSPIPGATSFLAGICSPDEIETVQKALSPASERIVRAYFSNVVERPGGELEMQLREIEGGRTFTRPIEPGSFVVNCTGHLAAVANPKVAKLLYSEAAPIVPVLSAAGRVFNCPSLPGFSGPNGNLGTHMFYRGLLTEAWLRENCVRVVTPTVVSTDKARCVDEWTSIPSAHTRARCPSGVGTSPQPTSSATLARRPSLPLESDPCANDGTLVLTLHRCCRFRVATHCRRC